MGDSIPFNLYADLHWREGDRSECEARLDPIFPRAGRPADEAGLPFGVDVRHARIRLASAAKEAAP